MAGVGKFLPDAPVVDFAVGRFKFNRVEDAMPVQDWCAGHVTDLRWDPDSSVFRLKRQTP
ncbi:MAG: hypothetical protein IIB60_06880 [Planctomycetes bacterium]|nr:hypothetical protein [Planctomycetota bacterium]